MFAVERGVGASELAADDGRSRYDGYENRIDGPRSCVW